MTQAGVLGSLKYDGEEDLWCLEVGFQIAKLELLRYDNLPEADVVLQKGYGYINSRLNDNDISYRFNPPRGKNSAVDDIEAQVDDFFRHLRQRRNRLHSLAFILLGQAGYNFSFRGCAEDVVKVEMTSRDCIASLNTVCQAKVDEDALFKRLQSCEGNIHRIHDKLMANVRVLLVSADPSDASRRYRLRLGCEMRNIALAIRASNHRENIEIKDVPSCRPGDLTEALRDFKPTIVHFAGHGTHTGLCFEDDDGGAILVSPVMLAGMFDLLGSIEGILLNACYTYEQATAIHQVVDNVICMEGKVMDDAAIAFAKSFYSALGAGESFEYAYRWAATTTGAQGLAVQFNPHILTRSH